MHGHSNFGFIIVFKKCKEAGSSEARRLSLLTRLTNLGSSSCRSMALCSTMFHNYHNYEFAFKKPYYKCFVDEEYIGQFTPPTPCFFKWRGSSTLYTLGGRREWKIIFTCA